MKRYWCVRVMVWVVGLALIPALAGCNGNSDTATFFDILQTGLLGVTAAGSVAILQNV